jgi:hypothetical protein
MYGMIVENLSFEPKSIIRHIQEKYKYTISYSKAWSAKKKEFEVAPKDRA